MDPAANNVLVETLGSSLRHGGSALDDVPDLLKRVLSEGAWRSFKTRMGEVVEHGRFTDFVTAAPLAGLGSSVGLVRRIVGGDTEARNLLDQALQNAVGHPVSTVSNIHERPAGTTAERALRKLRKDAPELHADVLAGNLSAHAAMVKAGYRKRTVSVPIEQPESVARTLRKHMSPDALQELIELLKEA